LLYDKVLRDNLWKDLGKKCDLITYIFENSKIYMKGVAIATVVRTCNNEYKCTEAHNFNLRFGFE
jgi:hypothetical protein